MIARRSVLIAVCIGLACAIGGARAAEPSAKAFVDAIYAAYPGKDAKGVPLDSNAKVRRYFAPRDRSAHHQGSQGRARRGRHARQRSLHRCAGLAIDAVAVAVQDIAANKARATVAFTNLGRPTTVVLDLVKLKQGWRISDIAWDRGQTLRGLLGKK
jgi:hypothetical protein